MRNKRPNKFDLEVGRRLRAQRLARKVPQTELARLLGVSFQQIQKYEKGVNRVGAGRLQEIASIFGVPVSFFYQRKGREPAEASELFGFMNTARVHRLIKAFSRIQSQEIQSTLVRFVELIAQNEKKR